MQLSRTQAQTQLLALGFQPNPGHRGELSQYFIRHFYEVVIIAAPNGVNTKRYQPKPDFEAIVITTQQQLGLK